MIFKGLGDVYLPVKNVDTSAEWYVNHFRMKESDSYTSGNRTMKRLSFNSTSFILVESETLNRYSHIPFNFHTNQIEELHRSLSEQGVTVTQLTTDEGLYCCDFHDPDGNRIGLVYEPVQQPEDWHVELGGTFLSVTDLEQAVTWYKEKLGYSFNYFDATGVAGYIGPTPEYVKDLTIHYASVSHDVFESNWSRICLVETPRHASLIHPPYSLETSDAESCYSELLRRNVQLTPIKIAHGMKRFSLIDKDGNEIEIVESTVRG